MGGNKRSIYYLTLLTSGINCLSFYSPSPHPEQQYHCLSVLGFEWSERRHWWLLVQTGLAVAGSPSLFCHVTCSLGKLRKRRLGVNGYAQALQLHPTLCDPMDCIPPGSSVRGMSQARILEWVAISFSRGSYWPRNQTRVSCIGRWIPNHRATTNGQDQVLKLPGPEYIGCPRKGRERLWFPRHHSLLLPLMSDGELSSEEMEGWSPFAWPSCMRLILPMKVLLWGQTQWEVHPWSRRQGEARGKSIC